MDKNMIEAMLAPSPAPSFCFDVDKSSHIHLPLIFLNIGLLLLFLYPCYRCCKLVLDGPVEPPSNITAMESRGNFDIVIELRDLERGVPEWENRKPCIFGEVSWSSSAASREIRCGGGDGDDSCTECCICLDEFKEGDECKVCSNCNHVYHKKCIEKWLVKSTSCPLCRGFAGWGVGGDHWCEISLSLPD